MSDVVFRRVRGRVIPIRKNKKDASQIKSAAIAASGIIVGAAGGMAAGGVEAQTKFAGIMAKSYMRRASSNMDRGFTKAAMTHLEKSRVILERGKRVRKFASNLKMASIGLGSTLLAAGIARQLSNGTNQEQREAVIGISGAAVGAVTAFAFKKSFMRTAFPFIRR